MLQRIFVLLPFLLLISAAHVPPSLRHRHIRREHPAEIAPRTNEAHREAHNAIRRQVIRRGQQCRLKASASGVNASLPATSDIVSSSTWTEPSSTVSSSSDWAATASATIIGGNDYAHAKSASHKSATKTSSQSSQTSPTSSSSSSGGLLSLTDATCGWCGSSSEYPNGSQDWINCGITGSGWTPPHVTLAELIAADLDASGPYAACSPYIDLFKKYGEANNVPPILLAAISMQESTCNPSATGGNGEAGLMQIAPPNCDNSGGSCWDVDYNINRGAQLLNQMVNANGNNVLAAIGSYNGWNPGYTTVSSATAAASQGDCSAQNNLDYVHQVVNGWMQGKNGNDIGSYFNLKNC